MVIKVVIGWSFFLVHLFDDFWFQETENLMIFRYLLIPKYRNFLDVCYAAMPHRRLLTVFALSMRYQAADVSLAVSCRILPRLLHLCDSSVLSRHLTGQARLSDISCILATASMRLLQILAITARSVIICNNSIILITITITLQS